jgi:hypothetical protein
LSGRCPRSKVGLLPDPPGKGTDSSCSTWTPSSPHFTSRSTTFASPARRKVSPVPKPPSAQVKSSPSPSLRVGAASTARGTSTATPTPSCGMPSLLCARPLAVQPLGALLCPAHRGFRLAPGEPSHRGTKVPLAGPGDSSAMPVRDAKRRGAGWLGMPTHRLV